MLENTDSNQICQTVLQLPLLYLRLLHLTDKFRNIGLEGTSWMAELSPLLSDTTQYVTLDEIWCLLHRNIHEAPEYFTSLTSLFCLLKFADHYLFCHVMLMDSMPECFVKGYILLSTYFKVKTSSKLSLSSAGLVTGEEICELQHPLKTDSYIPLYNSVAELNLTPWGFSTSINSGKILFSHLKCLIQTESGSLT